MTALVQISPIRLGPAGVPELTIGWKVLGWTAENLFQPDGPGAGEAWKYTPEQARFVLWWYAIDPHGRFIFRSGMLRRMKGWGKDPVGATLCCVEFVGPCRFSHFENGEPIAKPNHSPWIQIAAVSKDQNRNTMTLFPGMMSRKLRDEYDIELGKEIIYANHGGRRIEVVTNSPRALEGGRASFILKSE